MDKGVAPLSPSQPPIHTPCAPLHPPLQPMCPLSPWTRAWPSLWATPLRPLCRTPSGTCCWRWVPLAAAGVGSAVRYNPSYLVAPRVCIFRAGPPEGAGDWCCRCARVAGFGPAPSLACPLPACTTLVPPLQVAGPRVPTHPPPAPNPLLSSAQVYAPWCGHCKALAPVYEKLAKRFAKIDSVVIAKMDGTENEHPDIEAQASAHLTVKYAHPTYCWACSAGCVGGEGGWLG